MTSPGQRHANERLIERILNGDPIGPVDDDPRDYEPTAWTSADEREYAEDDARASDRYERDLERNHP